MLQGFLLLFGFQLLGEAAQRLLGLPLPGPVVGMLLLFAFLCLWGEVPKTLDSCSQGLIENLPLLLMVPAAGVFFLGAGFADQWPSFIVAIVGGTVATLVFAGLLLKRLGRRRSD